MKYIAQIIECNEDLEFILKIKIRNEILEVFSSSIPSFIDLKKNYLIALEATILDDYIIEEVNCPHQVKQIDLSLRYEIIGHLKEGKLDSNGLIFEDYILNRDFFYLDNTTVKWTVDRINATFDDSN